MHDEFVPYLFAGVKPLTPAIVEVTHYELIASYRVTHLRYLAERCDPSGPGLQCFH